MIRRLIGEDLGFVTAFGHEVGLINVDRGQVEQIILNLVVNARDAMPEGGKLTVETGKVVLDESYVATHLEASPGPHVYLAISDTGRGIAPAVAARMFEPFFTTKELGKGTGLGLSVVFGIVKQSGGSISVYSELGEGTTFRIYFPEATAPAEGLEDPPQVAPDLASLGGAEAILLVEDEEAVRHFAARVLEKLGYVVLEARNGAEAIQAFQRAKGAVDLLITDVVMPVMGGQALATRLREKQGMLTVLYMSGYAEHAVAHNGIVKSRQDFLHKPFSPLQLARKTREVLDKAHARHLQASSTV
jgi:two-component system cell cycle sensor histidine kinase/response regulator CckA